MAVCIAALASIIEVGGGAIAFAASLPDGAPDGVRSWPLAPAQGGKPGFTLLASGQTGITFTNQLPPEAGPAENNDLNGSGVALGDYDGDGWCDIFLCNLNGHSRLYRNLGNWKFQDVTAQAGLPETNLLARGAVFADVNGNGFLDLLVTYSGKGAKLFLNDGKGHFHDAGATELAAPTRGTSLALGDVNGDGFLDLYIANYGQNLRASGVAISTKMVGGKEVVVGRYRNQLTIVDGVLVDHGEPHAFFLNDGHGHFVKTSWTAGAFRDENGAPLAAPFYDMGLTACIRDINGDGNPDIYVCNDLSDPDRFWLGDGRGHFQLIPRDAVRHTSYASMAVDFADLNGDGLDDFIGGDMLSRPHELRTRQYKPPVPPPSYTLEAAADRPQIGRNVLQLSRGDGTYADIAHYAGLACSDWTWSMVFMDVDLDGLPDILVGTGADYDATDLDGLERLRKAPKSERLQLRSQGAFFPPLADPNMAFHNRGDLTFEEVGKQWGFDSTQVSHGIALADLDNDGDLDVVVNCFGGPALIYRNDCAAPRVAVKLKGAPPNTFGIGARTRLLGGAVPVQSQEMTCGRFLSSDAPHRTFAAGTGNNPMTLEVRWRGGKLSIVKNIKPNYLYEIDETFAQSNAPPLLPAAPTAMFEDASASLNHTHQDPPFDDFNLQKLLPRHLSQLGPGIAWYDLNGDGREDLIIGGGRGAPLGIYLNQGEGKWTPVQGVCTNALPDDSAGIVAGVLTPGTRSLLAGLAHYETDQTNLPAALRLDWNGPAPVIGAALPETLASTGPLAMADVDGDGALDLFVGGRLIAGSYPEPADSQLFLNHGGRLIPDPEANRVLSKAGLVTGAVFTDLNGDGFPDLVTSCEWGPARIFLNDHGHLKEWDPPLKTAQNAALPPGVSNLSQLLGLWSCVATGDFDGDGKIDIILGNWGLNTPYQDAAPGPWFLYYGDFNDDSAVHILEACLDPGLKKIMPWRDMSQTEADLPWLRTRFGAHAAYAKATMEEILSGRISNSKTVKANFLASILLLNRGDSFELRLLPPEAQWSPVMGLAVGDLDGDGNEDLFLSQNFFGVRPIDGRLDAGRGLLLRGDGKGTFTPIPGQTSGIKVYGEQRGCALADYDADGRLDLAVTQNNGQTRLFHNVTATPGLRVKLTGPPANPDAIGATLRLDYGDKLGPAREIQAGSGFWSQNSPVQVLAPARAVAIQVRWPGGKTTTAKLPPSTRDIQIAP